MRILYDILRDMYYGTKGTGPEDSGSLADPGASPASEPSLLWIGCADCRADHALIGGLHPDMIIAYRNIANQVKTGDASLSAVIQYAVGMLGVDKIVVCGHDNCRGLASVLGGGQHAQPADAPWDNWLEDAASLVDVHWDELRKISAQQARLRRLAEINVLAQVERLRRNPYVRNNSPELTIIPCLVDTAENRIRSLSGRLISRELQC